MAGLSSLRSVGLLDVTQNAQLVSLSGLGPSRAGGISVGLNPRLTDISALGTITTSGFVSFAQNDALVTLSGLDALTQTTGTLSLANNPSLSDIGALSQLTGVGVDLWLISNDALADLSGLQNLTHVGRTVRVSQHDSLANIDALANLVSVGSDLRLFDNSNLGECQVARLTQTTGASCSLCTGNQLCQTSLDCRVAACSAGACSDAPAPAGTACTGGVCDAGGVCLAPIYLDVFATSDDSTANPPATRDGVLNPGDEVSFGPGLHNDTSDVLTSVSMVRIVTSDPYVALVPPYPIYTNSVQAHSIGYAYPWIVVATDAPERHEIEVVLEADYTTPQGSATVSLARRIVIGPGESRPAESLSLDLVRFTDGDYRNGASDGILSPGEIVNIDTRARNWKRFTLSTGLATISTNDPYVTATRNWECSPTGRTLPRAAGAWRV